VTQAGNQVIATHPVDQTLQQAFYTKTDSTGQIVLFVQDTMAARYGVVGVVDTMETTASASIAARNFTHTYTSGMYRVSGTLEVTSGSALGAVTITLGFVNDNGAQTVVPISVFAATAAGQTYFSPIPIKTASGYITFATTVAGTPTHKLSLIVEMVR
jgi:hypothetical protein